jgi:hypothetical protein
LTFLFSGFGMGFRVRTLHLRARWVHDSFSSLQRGHSGELYLREFAHFLLSLFLRGSVLLLILRKRTYRWWRFCFVI